MLSMTTMRTPASSTPWRTSAANSPGDSSAGSIWRSCSAAGGDGLVDRQAEAARPRVGSSPAPPRRHRPRTSARPTSPRRCRTAGRASTCRRPPGRSAACWCRASSPPPSRRVELGDAARHRLPAREGRRVLGRHQPRKYLQAAGRDHVVVVAAAEFEPRSLTTLRRRRSAPYSGRRCSSEITPWRGSASCRSDRGPRYRRAAGRCTCGRRRTA